MERRVLASHATIIESLWPAPAQVGDEPPGPGATARADYLPVPDQRDPRFLLPRDRRAAREVLRHFRSDGSGRARWRIAGLRLALQTTGGWPLTRGRVAVSVPASPAAETIESHLRGILGEEITMGIHFGPPRANRKPILQVLGADHRPLAFGKVGVDPLTRRLVRAEGEALRHLADLALPGIRIPTLVHAGEWQDSEVLVTTPLPMREADHAVDPDLAERALVTLSRASGTTRARPGSSPWLLDLRKRTEALAHEAIRAALLSTIEHLAADQEDWEFGCWHGDCTRWNMASLDGEVLFWDWERFTGPVPLGWDALHFALRETFESTGPTVAVARELLDRSPALLAPFGVGRELAPRVTQAYLVELALRYTADGQRDAGGRTARVEEWLLPVLPRG